MSAPWLFAPVIALLQAAPSRPAANAAATGESAQGAIDRAADLFRSGQHEVALAALREAEPVAVASNDPAVATIRFNIARCLEELGRAADALVAYERYLSLPDEPHRKERAWASLHRLEGEVFGALSVSCLPAGARVEIRGVTTGPMPCPLDQKRLLPGPYEVSAAAVGAIAESRTVAVPAGRPTAVDFALIRIEAAVPGDSSAGSSPWPWVAFGLGAVAAGSGVWWTLTAKEERDQAALEPPGGRRNELDDAYQSSETLSWIGYGLALAGLATGTFLLLVDEAPPATAARGATPLQVRF